MTIPDSLTEADFSIPGGHKKAILDKLEEHREYLLYLTDRIEEAERRQELMSTALSNTLTSGPVSSPRPVIPPADYRQDHNRPNAGFNRGKGMYFFEDDTGTHFFTEHQAPDWLKEEVGDITPRPRPEIEE